MDKKLKTQFSWSMINNRYEVRDKLEKVPSYKGELAKPLIDDFSKAEVAMKAAILKTLREDRTTFFSLLPKETLATVAAMSKLSSSISQEEAEDVAMTALR